MRAAAAVVVGMVIGAVGALTAQKLLIEGTPMPSPAPSLGPTASPTPSLLPSPMCDAVVRLSFDGTNVHANPDRACLAEGRNVTWEIADDRAAVEIEFEIRDMQRGPFPHETDPNKNPHNQERGRYRREANDPRKLKIDSNPAALLGSWKYTVRWTPPGGPTREKDPVICIRR